MSDMEVRWMGKETSTPYVGSPKALSSCPCWAVKICTSGCEFLWLGASDSVISESEEDPFPNRLRAVVRVGSVVMSRRRATLSAAHTPMPKVR